MNSGTVGGCTEGKCGKSLAVVGVNKTVDLVRFVEGFLSQPPMRGM